MARSVDVVSTQPQAKGYDMVNKQRELHAHNSLAQGRIMGGVPSGNPLNAATGSPGAALGTGSNADRYTPVIEAV